MNAAGPRIATENEMLVRTKMGAERWPLLHLLQLHAQKIDAVTNFFQVFIQCSRILLLTVFFLLA